MQTLLHKIQSVFQFWLDQWPEKENEDRGSLRSFLIRIGSVLFLYVFFDQTIMRATHLPIEHYADSVIFFSFLKHLFATWYFLPVVAFVTGLLIFRKNLFCSWEDFSYGKSIRFVILVAAGILMWSFVLGNYNLYFDQGYYLDRILIFLVILLIYWRPVFVFLFLFTFVPTIWQLTVLPTSALTMPYLPIRILVLFASFFAIFLVKRKFVVTDFVFLLVCLVAAQYWLSGFGKVTWDWIRYDQIYLLLPATYANGWLGFLDSRTISSLTNSISYFNLPMKIFALVVEFGAFLILCNRHSFRFFFSGWILFHLGICFVSGIFFWMWMIIEAVLLWLFFKKDGFSALPIFTKKHLIVSAVLIVTGNFWCQPVKLAWFDVSINYTYRFEAETSDGKTYYLPPNFFAPYINQFTLGGFSYLNRNPSLPITWGATSSAKISRELMDIRSEKQFSEYERENGEKYFNSDRKADFDAFLKQYIQNWNRNPQRFWPLGYIQPPRNILTYPTGVKFEESKKIERVHILQIVSQFRGGRYREIRITRVHEISIP